MKKNIAIVLLITFILSLTSSHVFAAKNYVDLSEAEASPNQIPRTHRLMAFEFRYFKRCRYFFSIKRMEI